MKKAPHSYFEVGQALPIHDVCSEEVLHSGGHRGAFVQEALLPVAVNEACPLPRRETRRNLVSVVALEEQQAGQERTESYRADDGGEREGEGSSGSNTHIGNKEQGIVVSARE